MSFRRKILLSSALPVAVIMLAVTFIVIDQMRKLMLEAAEGQIRTELFTAAQVVEEGNQAAIAIARGMATAQHSGLFGRRTESLAMARAVLADNPRLIGSYIAYEPNADGGDRAWLRRGTAGQGASGADGRFIPYWFRAPGRAGTIALEPLVGMETSLYYERVKEEFQAEGPGAFLITEPYRYNDKNLLIEHAVPLVVDGEFAGVAGVDRSLDFFDSFLEELKPFQSARLSLISGRGRIIATTVDDGLGFDIRTMAVSDLYLTRDGSIPKDIYKVENGAYVLDESRADESRLANLSTDLRDRVRRFMEQVDSGEVHSFVAGITGKHMLGASARIPTGGWTMIFTVERDEIMRHYRGTLLTVGVIAIIGFLVCVTIIVALVTQISGRIRGAGRVARSIADGDLTAEVTVESGDESGLLQQAVRDMIRSLRALIGKIRGAALDLSGIATELFSGAHEQEQVVASFEASTNQISGAAAQIGATSEELASTMSDVKGLADDTALLAGGGKQSLKTAAGAMDRLRETVGSISHRLHEIEEMTAGVGMAVTTINKVADRTNMLSLSAAIEAEKAGEERTGFAIVAREVRRLADQTAAATLDIGQLVTELQKAASDGVSDMDSFGAEVAAGAADVRAIGGQLEGVIDRVAKLTGEFSQVNEGMQLQSAGAGQICDALRGLVDGVRQTGQTLEDFRNASEHLQGAVGDLRAAVARFRTSSEEEPRG